MHLIKLVRGKRYQFLNIIVQNGEVIDVDANTRNRLVKSKHFVDVRDIDISDFVPVPEEPVPAPVDGSDPATATAMQHATPVISGGALIDGNSDPATFGAAPAADGKTIHTRSGSDIVNQRAEEAKTGVPV